MDNFRKAAPADRGGRLPGQDALRGHRRLQGHRGSLVSLAQHPDPALEARLDELIDEIAAAQEPTATCTPTAPSTPPTSSPSPGRRAGPTS